MTRLLEFWSSPVRARKRPTAYDFFRPTASPKPWASVIWAPSLTPKHSFIFWLAAHGRLHTKDRLHLTNIDLSCDFCAASLETTSHLYFSCPFSAAIWTSIRKWLGLTRSMSTLASAIKWAKKTTRGRCRESRTQRIALASTVYHIWQARNLRIFEGALLHADSIVYRIQCHVYKLLHQLYPHALDRLPFGPPTRENL